MNLSGWDYSNILDSHSSWHHEDFTCDLCSKNFRSSGMLARHYSVHAEQSSFVCDVCSRPFNRKDNLINHKRRMHPGSDPGNSHLENDPAAVDENTEDPSKRPFLVSEPLGVFPCLHCSRTFSSRLSLGRHTKMLHSLTLPQNRVRVSPYLQFSRGFNLYEERPPGDMGKEVYLIQPALPEDRKKLVRGKVPPRYFCYLCPAKFRSLSLFTCHSKVIHGRSGLITYDVY